MKRYIQRSVTLLYLFTPFPIPTLPCRYPTLVFSGLPFLCFFCNDKQIHVCFLIFPFFAQKRARHMCFFTVSLLHLIPAGNHPLCQFIQIFNLTLFFTPSCAGNTAYATNLQYFPITYGVAVNNLVHLHLLLLKVCF